MASEQGSADKKATLKSIITELHGGLPVEQAKERFESEIGDISSTEIAQLEQGLLEDGVSVDEIKQFCNVHVLLFQSALEKATLEETSPSHPIALFRRENEEIGKRVAAIREAAADAVQYGTKEWKDELLAQLRDLKSIETHYDRKENVLFPHLEKVGFMGPSKVMWGKDNEVRELLKAAVAALQGVGDAKAAQDYASGPLSALLVEVEGMIFKEENILFPILAGEAGPEPLGGDTQRERRSGLRLHREARGDRRAHPPSARGHARSRLVRRGRRRHALRAAGCERAPVSLQHPARGPDLRGQRRPRQVLLRGA